MKLTTPLEGICCQGSHPFALKRMDIFERCVHVSSPTLNRFGHSAFGQVAWGSISHCSRDLIHGFFVWGSQRRRRYIFPVDQVGIHSLSDVLSVPWKDKADSLATDRTRPGIAIYWRRKLDWLVSNYFHIGTKANVTSYMNRNRLFGI